MNTPITLDGALIFVRQLEALLIPRGAHCALAGSVLHSGQSSKDLDVIVYPHSQGTPVTAEGLVAILKELFPAGRVTTDTSYPHDRFLFRIDGFDGPIEGDKWRVEMFVFLTAEK